MDSEQGAEGLKAAISKHTGKSAEEIDSMVKAKTDKFSGLLTEAGAAYMIAKELGVKTEAAMEKNTKISELKSGMASVNVVAAIKQVFPPKEFDKNGRKGKLQNLILTDGTGEIRATFWNTDIEKFTALGLGKGDTLKFSNCGVTSYNELLQLNLNYSSAVAAAEEKIAVPEIAPKILNINDLDAGMNGVCVKVKIKSIFPEKEFSNERGKGKVMNFIIAEGMQEMRATAWGEMCDKVSEFEEGDEVRIEGAYTKENRGEIELHLGRSARVMKAE